MKTYGIKDGTVSVQLETVDVVDLFPPHANVEQGKIVFKRGDGLFIFADGDWYPAFLKMRASARAPLAQGEVPSFNFNGIDWDISPESRQEITDSALRAVLNYSELNYSESPAPALIKTASGEKKFLNNSEILALAQAMLNYLNSQRS